MYLKYLLKNLVLLTPIRYGYYARLARYRDPDYVHDRDKHPVRHKHHGKAGWKSAHEGDFHYRDYADYEEYQTHQAQKFDEIIKIEGGFDNRSILGYRKTFYRRFRHLPRFLTRSARILCAGARQGTEVEVLHDLGFRNAFGVDLNPGPHNRYVRKGDFMALEDADGSIDMVYSNSVDHAYDLHKFFAEHYRVVRPGGFALYDIAGKPEAGAFEAIGWTSQEAVILVMLEHFERLLKLETERVRNWKWVLLQKAPEADAPRVCP